MSNVTSLVVFGLLGGSVYGLAAMGLVLTYKTSGVFNFAYGAMAMFFGFTFWQLRDGWHLTSWVSLPILLLVVAPITGVLAERLFRTVTTVSAEIQIVVALGVLAFLQALVPIIYGPQTRPLSSIFPTSAFGVGHSFNVGYDQLLTLIVAVVLGSALYVALRRTRFGMATQAVVDNRDLAELIGVSGDHVARIAWMVSSIFAAIVGVVLSASQGLDTYNLVLLVLVAFAPAVFGRLVSLPVAFAGALLLGVAQNLLKELGSAGTLADVEAALPFIALYVLLVVYGKGLHEVRSSVRAVTATGPVRSRRRTAAVTSAFLGVAGITPILFHGSLLRDMSAGLIFAAIALTLVVLTGWAGQISIAQFTFVGVGAFAAGHFGGAHGSGFVVAAGAGAAIALPLGVLVGLPSLRLSGLHLALATLASALIFDDLVFVRRSISGGLTGLSVARPTVLGLSFQSDRSFYYLAAALFATYAAAAVAVRRGPVGRRLQTIRDAPVAAGTFGVNLALTKLAVFAGCGAAAAFAGAFYGAMRQAVTPGDFAFGASLELLLLVVLGGRALVGGALIAGATYTLKLLPLAASVSRYIPLAVALGVIALAQHPEGPLSVIAEQARKYSALFRPLPRPAPSSSAGADVGPPLVEPSNAPRVRRQTRRQQEFASAPESGVHP